MSEGKRATLISFGSQKVSEKRTKEIGKTIRISLVLPQSNEDTCPEFNYKEELAAVKKKDVLKLSKSEVNGLNLHGDDDEDLKRIAAEFEAKYGTDSYSKKKKKGRRDDYADIGMGYDESDSFIDNTDGYDEMIPEHVSPLHGGFYINSGALEFRADDKVSSDETSSSDDESVPEKLSSRKHPLESSDESEREKETDTTEEKAAKKLKLSDTPKSKKHSDDGKVKHVKKIRPHDDKRPSATVRELLRQKRTDLDMNIPPDLQSLENVDKNAVEEANKKPLSSVALASINDTIESVVKATVEVPNNHESKNTVVEASRNKAVVLLSSEGESSRDSKTEEIVKLPENLPSDILEIISNIKQAASTSWEGKVKFFTGPVNKMLLSLEKKCRCLGKQSRMRVYEHLAPFVRCRKETLIRRAKNLFLESEQNKIETLSKELKTAIDRVMPPVLEAYEAECQKVLIKKFSKDGQENEENKALRMPHKRFPWTDDTRKMVKDIVVARKRCFLLEGKQRESLETKLNEFLKQNIQPLWPEGWMSMTSLSKVCGNVPDAKKQLKDAAAAKPQVKTNSSLELPQNLSMNPSLSITPLPAAPPTQQNISASSDNLEVKLNNVLPDLEITKTVNSASNGVKQEICDSKVEVHDQPPVLQPEVIPKAKLETLEKECQVIDLTGHADLKRKTSCQKPKSRYYQDGEKVKVNNEGDDIQKVMEGLKVLQKMSSPVKTSSENTTSSPVSVIAFNKSYSPKSAVSQPSTSSNSSVVRPSDYTKADFCTGFQEQFQKQLLGDVNFLKTSSSQPAPSFKATNLLPSDDYMQNPNNNFSQHAQGTYNNIMEDMFTNLLSEYGYGRSALPKARQPKK